MDFCFLINCSISFYNGPNIFKDNFGIGNYYITENKYKELQSCELFPGDIVISMMGTIGACAVFPEHAEKGIMNSHLLRLQFGNDMLPEFVKLLLRDAPSIKIEMEKLSVGTIMTGLSSTVIKKLNLPVPSIKEQKKISAFFTALDKSITLHQRKLEKLKNFKKAMLEKMFPKNGEKTPEIRFQGFTDDWEQRKFSKIAIMHARIGWQNLRTSEFLDDGDYYLITGTDFIDGRVDFSQCHYVAKERYNQDKNIQIDNGSILITKDGTLGKVAYVNGLNKPATLNAGVFNVVIKINEVDGKYLYQYLKGPFLMDYVLKRATGGTIKHLNQNILVNFPVEFPSFDEQKKIGETLQELDNLITLHQRKLEKLKQIKKAMLEKMFV